MTTSHLNNRFASDPQEVLKFLATYVPDGMDLSSGLPVKTDFRRDAYNLISELIDTDVILTHLRSLYGAGFDPVAEVRTELLQI